MDAAMKGIMFLTLIVLALLPWQSRADDAANLEGMWKIAAPQYSFKPEGGSIPFTVAGRKRYQENMRLKAQGKFDEYDYARARCASPGLPRLMITPERFRIWQRPGTVAIQFEWNRLLRQIDLGGLIPQRRVGPAAAGLGGGGDEEALVGRAIPVSKGKWEGDTLILTTEGFAANTLVDDVVPHGYDMKLTERIRLRDADTLEDRITIEDPEFFTRPWQTVVSYKRQPDAVFPESVCLDTLNLEFWPPGKGARGPAAVATSRGSGAGLPTHDVDDRADMLARGFVMPRPPLPANAPQPSPDPRNFDGTWYHEDSLVFYIGVDMFGNPVPFTDEGRKVTQRRWDSIDKKGAPFIYASTYCIPTGQPLQFDLNMPFQVFQTKDHLNFTFEEYHGLWQISLDPDKVPAPGYMGPSVAHWDGDTLVVETKGFKEGFWVTGHGSSASKDAKLTQRIRKVKSGDRWYLEMIYTLDDPTFYTRPWSWARKYAWHPDMTLFREYNCELSTGAKGGLDPSLVPEPQS